MDDIFNIRPLSNNRVGTKTNELDNKDKEKSYERSAQKKKATMIGKSDDSENMEEKVQEEIIKKKIVDVFI